RHVHDDVEVAGRTATQAVLAFTVEAEALAVGNAGRNLHRHPAILRGAAGATARGAGIAHDAPGGAAGAARARDDQEALLEPELARPAAVGADVGRRARGRARAVAGRARLFARNLDRLFAAGVRLVERDLEIEAQVGAAHRPLAARPAAEAAEAEEVTEDVGEVGEDVGVEAARTGALARHPRVAEAVVAGALLGIAEHGVGLGRFLEALLGFGVARVAVGVVLQRQLAVGALDVLLGRSARNAQDLVVIAHRLGLGHADERRAEQALTDAVAAPDLADHLAVGPIPGRLGIDGFVPFRIELRADGVDRLDVALAECVEELLVDHLDARAQRR